MAPTKLCKNKAHKLREEDKGEKYVCDGCKTKGKGRKYICEACKGHFHHECIDFKPKICPEMFKEEKGSYEFEFSMSVPPTKSGKRKKNCPDSRNCEACGMPVKGYAYRCKKTDKDLHPRCAFLDKEILVPLPADEQVKLVMRRKGLVTLKSDVNDCCSICQSAELPAAAAGGVDGKVPGWSYISDNGEISFHVFCMLQIWFKNSTANIGGPKLLESLDRKKITAETQDIKHSKKNQGGGSGGAVTKVIINENTGTKPQVKASNIKDYGETSTQDNSKKKGGDRGSGRGGVAKENENNAAQRKLVKHGQRDQIQKQYSKEKKKKGVWGGRKSKCCVKILVKVLSVVFSALIGDVTGLVGSAVLEAANFVFDNLA